MMNVHKTELDGVVVIEPNKCSDFFAPECEGGVLCSDPDVAIDWPLESSIVSEKDAKLPCLTDIAEERLPSYK